MKFYTKLILLFVVLGFAIAIGVYYYLARPVDAPSADVADEIERLEEDGESSLYEISGSVAFELDENLRGEDIVVRGETSDIAGTVLVSDDLSETEVGEIKVNARTFETDNATRDGAIVRLIFKSEEDANEFITFNADSFSVIDGSWDDGSFEAVVSGALTISGVTQEVDFDLEAERLGAAWMVSGEATVMHADFGLTIPELDFIASVGDEVTLLLDLRLVAAE